MRELKQSVQWQYLAVCVWVGGKQTRRHVHRLLAIAFIPNPHNKEEVNHIDGDKLNNNLTNLEWVTKKENAQHAQRIGLSHRPVGEDNGRAVLDEQQVLEIYHKLLDGVSNLALSREYGVERSTIASIKQRKAWKHILQTLPPVEIKRREKTAQASVVYEICSLLSEGLSPTPIAKRLGVPVDLVYDVKRRKSFRDISDGFEWK